MIWSKLLGEWSRLLGRAHFVELARLLSLEAPGMSRLPAGAVIGASMRADEALAAELASQGLGHWMRWVDASAWLANDTLSYVQRLQAEFVRATQELHAHSERGEHL